MADLTASHPAIPDPKQTVASASAHSPILAPLPELPRGQWRTNLGKWLMAYEIERHGRVAYFRFIGLIAVSELAGAVIAIASDPQFDDQRFQVVDFSAATLPPMDANVFNAVVPVIGATGINPYITAIVVPDNEQTRAFMAFCSPLLGGLRSVQFLQDRTHADSWISDQSMIGLTVEL